MSPRLAKMVGATALAAAMTAAGLWFVVTQPILTTPDGSSAREIDPQRLKSHVYFLSENVRPRDWDHPDNLDRAAGYIRDELVRAGADVSEQTYEMEGNTYRNVIASFGPTGGERLIIGAHYDAFGDLPGADDNASGVAGLIELAHVLGGSEWKRRIDLVAFTLEEPKTKDGDGLFRSEYGGSAVYVNSLLEEGVGVRVFLNLEMIGYFSDENGSQTFPIRLLNWFYPTTGNFITIVGRLGQGGVVRTTKAAMHGATKLPVYSMSAHEIVEGVDWSDHSNFWKAGYDAVMITDTSFLRNRAYHTERDTANRLDFERMALVVQGVYAAISEFSR